MCKRHDAVRVRQRSEAPRTPQFVHRKVQIAIQNHLDQCPPCLTEARVLQSVGDALRLAAAPGPADDWTGLQPGVISRMKAEAHESWTARARRLFDDMHLVWIAFASTAATVVCGAIVLGMLHFASPERGDSLAAMIAAIGAPSGSDLNPASLDGVSFCPQTRNRSPTVTVLPGTTSITPVGAVVRSGYEQAPPRT